MDSFENVCDMHLKKVIYSFLPHESKVLFLTLQYVTFLFGCASISRELLNGFAPNSHGRRVCP